MAYNIKFYPYRSEFGKQIKQLMELNEQKSELHDNL